MDLHCLCLAHLVNPQGSNPFAKQKELGGVGGKDNPSLIIPAHIEVNVLFLGTK